MTRPIEFRAWVKDLKEYRKVAAIHYVIVNGLKVSHVELWGRNFADKEITRSFCDVVLEQFTGLLDRNGKKIHEGDVVGLFYATVPEKCNEKVVIVWDDIHTGWEGERPGGERVFLPLGDYTQYEMEVIGNIHEKEEK